MQGQDTPKTNVVSLFSSHEKDGESQANQSAQPTSGSDSETFAEIMERNLKNQQRMAKERANANKSVLRSYRIKH